jgi:hypothetical protein
MTSVRSSRQRPDAWSGRVTTGLWFACLIAGCGLGRSPAGLFADDLDAFEITRVEGDTYAVKDKETGEVTVTKRSGRYLQGEATMFGAPALEFEEDYNSFHEGSKTYKRISPEDLTTRLNEAAKKQLSDQLDRHLSDVCAWTPGIRACFGVSRNDCEPAAQAAAAACVNILKSGMPSYYALKKEDAEAQSFFKKVLECTGESLDKSWQAKKKPSKQCANFSMGPKGKP